MKLAVNYSPAAIDLLRAGLVRFDLLKCPAWPQLMETLAAIYPFYVHFPLRAGAGIGEALDSEKHGPADWTQIESVLASTNTPLVNLHLELLPAEHPDIPPNTTDPAHIERLTRDLISDVRAVVARFGPERVVIENDHSGGRNLPAAYRPDVICRVVEETNCGLLLDVAHARIAAGHLNVDVRQYIEALPVQRIRELHITGVQYFGTAWVERLRQAGEDENTIRVCAGRWMDHLPMTDEDWELAAWALERVRSGAWSQPGVVAFECGGVGPFFGAMTDDAALARDIPRLYALVHAAEGESSVSLTRLLAGISEDQLHREVDFGPAVGNESW